MVAVGVLLGSMVLASIHVLGTGHTLGPTFQLRPRQLERQIFTSLPMDGIRGVEVRYEGGNIFDAIAVNHLQVVHGFGEDLPRLNSVQQIILEFVLVCQNQAVTIATDGDILRSLEEASDSPCSGIVSRGGPLGSEFSVLSRGRVSIRFTRDGGSGDHVMVGALSYPGALVQVQGLGP